LVWTAWREGSVTVAEAHDALAKLVAWRRPPPRPAWRARLAWLELQHTGDVGRARAEVVEARRLYAERGTRPMVAALAPVEAALTEGDAARAGELLKALADSLEASDAR